jgi:hypothetical protein
MEEPAGLWSEQTNLKRSPLPLAGEECFSAGLLLFGIATFRTAILPRWAPVIFSIGGLVVHAFLFLPKPIDLVVASLLPLGFSGLYGRVSLNRTGFVGGSNS